MTVGEIKKGIELRISEIDKLLKASADKELDPIIRDYEVRLDELESLIFWIENDL